MTWAGPLACYDFGRAAEEHGEKRIEAVDEVTRDCFVEAMRGELEAVGFRTEAGFDGLLARGTLWGGNLTMLVSLLGTPHWPKVRGGVLFVEDVNEHPYRVERRAGRGAGDAFAVLAGQPPRDSAGAGASLTEGRLRCHFFSPSGCHDNDIGGRLTRSGSRSVWPWPDLRPQR